MKLTCRTKVHRSGAVLAFAAGALTCSAAPDRREPSPVVESPAVLAQARSEIGGLTVQILEAVRTSEAVLEVRFALVNLPSSQAPLAIESQFASEPADVGTVADMYLVDTSGARKYFVIRDAQQRPACSANIAPIRPGETRRLWARFLAPPPEVARIGIRIPHVPDALEVPITPEPDGHTPRM
jgi:hypothetical protein